MHKPDTIIQTINKPPFGKQFISGFVDRVKVKTLISITHSEILLILSKHLVKSTTIPIYKPFIKFAK